MTTIVWFRQDLRVADNPALAAAAETGAVLPVFILDEGRDPHPLGGASRWWLHHGLAALERSLGGLTLLRGDPRFVLPDLAQRAGARAIHWNRCYEPHAVARDSDIKHELGAAGLEAKSFKAAVLFEPWEVKTGSGGPYKVFTPFWRSARTRDVPDPLPRPKALSIVRDEESGTLQDLGLLPRAPDWAAGWADIWTPGEAGADARLAAFLEGGLRGYAHLRDRPDCRNTSRLSAHLHFGEISPRQVWARTRAAMERDPSLAADGEKFLAEIGWREYAQHLLYHFPQIPAENWKPGFDAYPWRDDAADLDAWKKGLTGYPMVDAGMRELWATGTMHNRVRMLAASFLVKHLRIHWRRGEAWFRDTLVDADLANNAAGWQWVAGSGADAAPYFRIFSPIGQGRKFDPDGAYVRRWCPELAALETRYVHAPFEAPPEALEAAGVTLGRDYPRPIVDHKAARQAALAGYESVKRAQTEEGAA